MLLHLPLPQLGDTPDLELAAHPAEFDGEQAPNLFLVRRIEDQHLVESAPDGRIQDTLVVGRRNQQALAAVAVEHLQERIDHPRQLPVVGSIRPLLGQGFLNPCLSALKP